MQREVTPSNILNGNRVPNQTLHQTLDTHARFRRGPEEALVTLSLTVQHQNSICEKELS